MVATPIRRSAASVTRPRPRAAPPAAAPGRRPPRRAGTTTSPSGLPRSVAILAASFTSATPAETASPVSAAHLALDARRDGRPVAVEGAAGGDVEEGLVERERLDQRRVAPVDVEDLVGELAVAVEARVEEDALRAEPAGLAVGMAERTPKRRAS